MVSALSSDHKITAFEWGDPLPVVQGMDVVIHLGAISSTTERNVEKVMKQNYDFSVWMLNQCIKFGVHMQYASSASVYGQNMKFAEDSPVDPKSPYAWSKYLFDHYVSQITSSHPYIQGFRYFNVYGPNEDHKGNQASPYHKFEKQAKETGIIRLFEDSDKYQRDFVSVQKVIDVHKKFLYIPETGIWNVGSGVAKSFLDVADEISQRHKCSYEFIPMPEEVKRQYQYYTCADLKKLHNTMRKYAGIS